MKVVCTIEARMRSTRLPGKVLRPILGRPMLGLMVERLRQVRGLDGIVIATTEDPSCDPIAAYGRTLGVGVHRGSEDDVLGRVLGAAQGAGADVIIETTGDCPLIDPEVVERALREFRAGGVDYVSNTLHRTYPRGLDVQVFPTRVLADVAARTQDPADREHVSLYIYEHPERYRLHGFTSGLPSTAAEYRLTVDTADDFEVVRRIFEALYPPNPRFRLADVLAFLGAHPEVARLNQAVVQKEVRAA